MTRDDDKAKLANNPRASATAWLRYSHIAEAAFAQHPLPYRFVPSGTTPYNVAAKLRDAVRGKIAFDYPSGVSGELIEGWWMKVVVSLDGDAVIIGPRQQKKDLIEGVEESAVMPFTFVSLTADEFSAFEVLLSSGRLKGPVQINEPDIRWKTYPQLPNVERIWRDDKRLILL